MFNLYSLDLQLNLNRKTFLYSRAIYYDTKEIMKTRYVLVTPAYNEEKFMDGLIQSVIAQTILPLKWVIIDDGSADATYDIIKRYQGQHSFISCIRLNRDKVVSYYSRRTNAVLLGIKEIKNMEYDFLAVLDADITIEPNYFEGIMQEFDRDPKLGIAAGIFRYVINGRLQTALTDRLCTSGSHQVFRRECYDQIGGYVSLKYGGDDSLVDIMARMYGWKTSNFNEYPVVQNRIVGTGDGKSVLGARFYQGLTDYGIATHPVFMIAKCLRRAFLEKPYILGGMAKLAGFLSGYLRREERQMLPEAISFVRKEQIKRLFSWRGN